MLTEEVKFKILLQKGNRLQVPKLVRLQYKMEPNQILKVGVHLINAWGNWERFYARMSKDGRIRVPKLIMQILQGEKLGIDGCALEVALEPAG